MPHKQNLVLPITLSIVILISSAIAMYFYYTSWNQEVLAGSEGIVEIVENDNNTEVKDLQTIIHEAQKYVVQIEAVGSTTQSEGSGFLYNNKGDIVTNAHVVEDATDIFVKTSDGSSTYPGALIDMDLKKDVAVIRVPQLKNEGSMEIDPNFEPNTGDEIIAVGSPHGFSNTFTDGIISAKGRSFTVENYEYNNLYQVSANISQGNSGGPLIHKNTGLIIGINTAANREGNMGFTIPISQVYDLIQMWSDMADNQELSYDINHQSVKNVNPESLKNDASYLLNYYYDTLNVRDYFTAYSLLGSNEQIKRTYQDFRDLSVQAVDIEVQDTEFLEPEDDQIKANVSTDHHIRLDEQTMEVHHYKTTFTIGYENDQLKILSFKRELLSKTEQQINPEDLKEEDKSNEQG